MYGAFGVCIVLEDQYDIRDCIDGVYQKYEKTHYLREQEELKSYSQRKYEFITMDELFKSQKYYKLSDRSLLNLKEQDRIDLTHARDLIDKMKILYDIFNSPSLIHMKFMKLHMYTIKRLAHLTF